MLRVLFLFTSLTLIACQPTKKEESDVISGGGTDDDSTTTTTGNTVVADTSVFTYVINSLTQRYGVSHTSPAMPADGSPVIDASGAITSLTAPTLPSDQNYTVPQASYVIPPTTAGTKVNVTTTTLSHKVYLTDPATSCSSSVSTTCTVDSTNDKLITLGSVDPSTLPVSTTSLAVTVDSKSVSVPAKKHTITRSMDNAPNGGGNQYSYNLITGAVFTGDYFYYIGQVVISGSYFQSLFRVHKSSHDTAPVYNPTQSPVSGGKLKNIVAFNGKVYFGSRPYGYSDYRFLAYDTATSGLTQISSSSELLNPGQFLVHNNHLYFTANSSGQGARLYKMSTSGAIKQLTDLCGANGDIGYKMLPTNIGIYVSLSDPAGCSNDRIIVRIKNDDSVIPLAFYRPGTIDTADDGLGAVAVQGGKYYFSAGNEYYLYEDKNDGTITNLLSKKSGFGITAVPVKKFVADSRGIFWIRDDYTTTKPMHYDPATGNIQTLYQSSSNYTFRENILKLGNSIVFLAAFSTNSRRYNFVTDDFNFAEYFSLNGSSHDEIFSLGKYNGEEYFYGRNSTGMKLWKFSSDKKFIQLSNINSSGNDFNVLGADVFMTSGGIVFPHPSGGAGMLIFQ